MRSTKKQGNFAHGDDWQSEHELLAADPEIFDSLKFDGLIVDVDGQSREQRRCPACQSTFSGPPISLRRALEVLRESAQKLDASLDQLARAASSAGAGQIADHSQPPRNLIG